MDTHCDGSGRQTLLEHWGTLVTVILVFLASQVLLFFMELSGAPWLWFFVTSSALLIVGGGLIGYAKFPVYRSGRF